MRFFRFKRRLIVNSIVNFRDTSHRRFYSESKKPARSNGKVMRSYWQDPAAQRRFFDNLAAKLNLADMHGWYDVRHKTIKAENGGSALLRYFGGSHIAALRAAFPEHTWQDWKFVQVPQNWWTVFENRRQFMEYVRAQEGWANPEDFYHLTAKILQRHGGSRLLQLCGDSPSEVVKSTFPEHNWVDWRFLSTSNHYWHDPKHRREFFDSLRQHHGLVTFESCYSISEQMILAHGGESILRKFYHGSVGLALVEVYPEHAWEAWKQPKIAASANLIQDPD